MSKYAEYMRSIDNNRTIYDFGEVGASVTYDVELNQTEIAFLTRKGDDLDFDGSHDGYQFRHIITNMFSNFHSSSLLVKLLFF